MFAHEFLHKAAVLVDTGGVHPILQTSHVSKQNNECFVHSRVETTSVPRMKVHDRLPNTSDTSKGGHTQPMAL